MITRLNLWKSLILLKALLSQYPVHCGEENQRVLRRAWEDLEAMDEQGITK